MEIADWEASTREVALSYLVEVILDVIKLKSIILYNKMKLKQKLPKVMRTEV